MNAPHKKATALDVAHAAGVSKWTVARAFTPGAPISEKNKKTILDIAERMGYRPNLLARSLSTRRTHQVAIMIDDFGNPHKLLVLDILLAELQANNLMGVLIHLGREFDVAHAFLTADQRQVDAIVLFGSEFHDQTLADASREGSPPLYVFARPSQIDDIVSVNCNAEIAMKEIVEYLAEKGYKKPGFMSGPTPAPTALGRQEYHAKYWARHGVENIIEIPAGHYSLTAARAAMRTYLASTPSSSRIDVLVCENDVLAIGAQEIARHEFQLTIPDDLAIVGFDGLELMGLPSFDITTYEQPIEEMSRIMVGILKGELPRQSHSLRGRLLKRGSA